MAFALLDDTEDELIKSINEPNITLQDILDAQKEYNLKVQEASKACLEMKKAGEHLEEMIFHMDKLILKGGES